MDGLSGDLFESERAGEGWKPLADRMRPRTLDEVVGQQHLLGPGRVLREAIESGHLFSMILWGPPGCGKTALALLVAERTSSRVARFSAVLSGVKEIREVIAQAQELWGLSRKKTVLFVDEIHRFNKAQQDAFLPHVESGRILLVGATTENPSFEVNKALLSRCKVLVLEPLSVGEIEQIVRRALADADRGLAESGFRIEEEALAFLCSGSQGDARSALNTLERTATLLQARGRQNAAIQLKDVEVALQKTNLMYDKTGEEHYNLISAFIKSMRGSDPDAALYWMVRMLEGGEDPLFIARRMVIFASEDIGNADPMALTTAVSAKDAIHFVGLPEAVLNLSHAVSYLACAPKSNASYLAYKAARKAVNTTGGLPVPLRLRNAPTGLMKELDYGKGYRYPHDEPNAYVPEDYLPEALEGEVFYRPTDRGYERTIRERLTRLRSLRARHKKK